MWHELVLLINPFFKEKQISENIVNCGAYNLVVAI